IPRRDGPFHRFRDSEREALDGRPCPSHCDGVSSLKMGRSSRAKAALSRDLSHRRVLSDAPTGRTHSAALGGSPVPFLWGRVAMADEHTTGRHMLETGERFVGRTLAVALGVVLMVSGLGMGVTIALLPIGLPLGLVGLLLAIWGLFYSTPATSPAPTEGHGQGAGHGPAAH